MVVGMRCSQFVMCFFFKQKTAYEMRISDWSSDVCSSDLRPLVSIFLDVHDPANLATANLAVSFLAVAALFQLVDAAQAVGAGVLRGIQDTKRSEERRVGKECVSTCSSRWSPYHSKKKTQQRHIKRSTVYTYHTKHN